MSFESLTVESLKSGDSQLTAARTSKRLDDVYTASTFTIHFLENTDTEDT